MGEEIYGQHETRQAGTGKRTGGREGEFSTSFLSARKGFESGLEPGKALQAAWALGEVASRQPHRAEHNSLQQLTTIPGSRCCCTLHKLCLNKCSNKNGSASHPVPLNRTYSSLCDKILPRLWKSSLLSVLTTQTQAQQSWVVHGLWRLKCMRAGGRASAWWHPHHKVIFPLLCSTKASSPWHFHRECFPFFCPEKLTIWGLPQI